MASLEPAVFRVMVAMAAQYSGGNNGALSLTRAVAREYGIRSVGTLKRSLAALCERHLLERTHPGTYVPPTAACYAITWRALDNTDWTRKSLTATHAYRGQAWSRGTAAPAKPYRGEKAGGRIPQKTKTGVRPPDPAGPLTGPFTPVHEHQKRFTGPLTGPILSNAGTAQRTPLDIYHSVEGPRACAK